MSVFVAKVKIVSLNDNGLNNPVKRANILACVQHIMLTWLMFRNCIQAIALNSICEHRLGTGFVLLI